MKCPKCTKEMEVVTRDTSHDKKNKKEYSRTVYHCKEDDVWGNMEIPKIK